MKKKVLVVSYAGGHLNNLLPIVIELRKRGIIVEFLVVPYAESILSKKKIKHSSNFLKIPITVISNLFSLDTGYRMYILDL